MENVYQAPVAEPLIREEVNRFYVVSQKKLWVMSLVTVGLYQAYWFYKHWRIHKKHTGGKLWAVARTIFSVFYTHKLFRLFTASADEKATSPTGNLSGVATAYVVLIIAERVISKIEVTSPLVGLLFFVTLPLAICCISKAQGVANIACDDVKGESNKNFTAANIVWMVVGAVFWLLFTIGTLDTLGILNLDESLGLDEMPLEYEEEGT